MVLLSSNWSRIARFRIRTLALGWLGAVLLSLLVHWGPKERLSAPDGASAPAYAGNEQLLSVHIFFGLLGFLGLVVARRLRLAGLENYRRIISRLRASEERYRLLVETSPAAVVVLDDSGRILEVNGSALELYGAAEASGILLQPARAFIAPEDQKLFEEFFRTTLSQERVSKVEVRVVRQHGGRFLAEVNAAVIPSRGEGRRVIAVVRDLSEQHAMVSALRKSEERYRRISGLISDFMPSFTVDEHGRLALEWTAGASERITGYSLDELNERGGLFSLIDQRDLPRARQNFAALLQGAPYSDDFRFTAKSGQSGWVHSFGMAEKDPSTGEVVRLYHAVQDISATKSAEAQLLARTAQLEAVLQHSPLGVVVLDPAGKVMLWNLGAERILGWPAKEALGQVPPGLTAEQRALISERFSKTPAALPGEHHHFVRKDGTPIEVLLTSSLFPDESGAIAGMIGVFEDVTDARRNAELAAARLRFGDLAQRSSTDEILRAILDEAENITGSRIGFLHLIDSERQQVSYSAWSKRTMESCKAAVGAGQDFQTHAELWADCIREGKPIVHNHRACLPHRPGLVPGHVGVSRDLLVPVLREGRVVAVLGVGNCPVPYSEKDVDVVAALAGMAWDLIVRRRAEDELRASEQRLRAIFDSVPDPVYLKDAERRYTHVNAAFERYFCTTAQAVVGKTREEVFNHPNADVMLALERQALSGTPVRKEVRLVLGGEERDVEFVKTPIFDKANQPIGICSTARDLTERNRTEAALRRAHSRAQRLLEVAGVMIVASAPDGTIALINRKGCEILGCEQEDVLGTNWLRSFVPEPDQPWVSGLLSRLTDREISETGSFEVRFTTRLGIERVISWNSTLVSELDGTVLGIISSGEDVTERRQAEETLRHAEARQRLTLESAGLGTWDFDAATGVLVTGGRQQELFGFRAGTSAVPAEVFSRVHPDDRPAVKRVIESSRETRAPFSLEFRVVLPIGEVRWLRTQGQVINSVDEPASRILGVVWDVTERRQIEEDLHRSRERLQVLFDYSPIAIWEEDFSAVKARLDQLRRDGSGDLAAYFAAWPEEVRYCASLIKIVDANRASVGEMGAATKSELIESFVFNFDDEALETVARILVAFGGGSNRIETELPMRNFRREQRIFSVTATVVPGCEETLEKILVSFMDITERKRTEQALRASLLEKEAMLKEIHHRVKNNLQLVSSLMRLRRNQLESVEGRAALEDTQARIRSMALLHEALYRSSNLAKIDLPDYIGRLTTQLLSAATCSELVEIKSEIEPLSVSLDTAIPCGLIINELVVNSLKHAFPAHQPGTVLIQMKKLDQSHARLLVGDNGRGWPPGIDLTRLESLGLQLVGDLVRQLGGIYELAGPPGATFMITFPISSL